jgi:hypothetical protein
MVPCTRFVFREPCTRILIRTQFSICYLGTNRLQLQKRVAAPAENRTARERVRGHHRRRRHTTSAAQGSAFAAYQQSAATSMELAVMSRAPPRGAAWYSSCGGASVHRRMFGYLRRIGDGAPPRQMWKCTRARSRRQEAQHRHDTTWYRRRRATAAAPWTTPYNPWTGVVQQAWPRPIWRPSSPSLLGLRPGNASQQALAATSFQPFVDPNLHSAPRHQAPAEFMEGQHFSTLSFEESKKNFHTSTLVYSHVVLFCFSVLRKTWTI